MTEKITTEMISRRKALSLLGLGAALGLTLSSALEPLEAEAQEATGTAAAPLRPRGPMGCDAGKGGAPIGTSDATRVERVSLHPQRQLRPPQRLRRNNGPCALSHRIARFDELRITACIQPIAQWARRQAEITGGSEGPAVQWANIL